MIQLSLDLNLKAHEADLLMETAPSGCLIAFIGQKSMHRIDDIIAKVETVSQKFNVKSPTFFIEKANKMPAIFHKNPPAMVTARKLTIDKFMCYVLRS